MRDTGQPGEPSPAQLKGGRGEATRGDSPPESPEDATAGQPEGARLAHPEDAGTGATRGLIARLDGTIDDPMSYAAQKKTPETPVSGVFNLRHSLNLWICGYYPPNANLRADSSRLATASFEQDSV